MNDDSLFDGMEEFAKFVAVCTGMRQQFIDAGWSSENAEALVVHAMRQGGNT
jgi:hypothetical protein